MFEPRIEQALRVALEAHGGQLRRAGELPYVVHPLHVALLLERLGADAATVQAGLLHDVVEDCPAWTLDRLRVDFGDDVASIVAELTEDKALPWAERKRLAIEGVACLSPGAVLVKGCDKLHNLGSLVAALRDAADRDALWERFRGGRAGTLATARALVEALSLRLVDPLAGALRQSLGELEALA
jgi:(p)ppGpp synthase/HD superfamily hydrolase